MDDFWRPATADVLTGLADWAWLVAPVPLEPKFCSPFADVFFASEAGPIWHLSPILGELTQAWAARESMMVDLATQEGMDTYGNLVWTLAAQRRGLELGAGESFHFVPPPALGGRFNAEAIEAASTKVVLSLAGQLHRSLRLPDAEAPE